MDALRIWTIYCRPRDYPHSYVVRVWETSAEGVRPTEQIQLADTLAEARATIPVGLCRLPRAADDDPAVVECWL